MIFIPYFINYILHYLANEINITTTNGDHAVNGFNGLITLIDCKIPINKKYTFANLLNCNIIASIKYYGYFYLEENLCMYI